MAPFKRDYYEVLGVPNDADDEAIRDAFRALARDWHPDVAEAPDAEVHFRELAEAYSVLSRPESRLLYDRHGYRGRGNQSLQGVSFEDALNELRRGQDVQLDLELRSFESEQGGRPIVEFRTEGRCVECLGTGVELGTAQATNGNGSEGSTCSRCGGAGVVEVERRLRVVLPPGLGDGAQLRIAGEGADAGADSIPGDLLIKVHVLPPPRDPRTVRYIALVLLVIAVAALAVYVLH